MIAAPGVQELARDSDQTDGALDIPRYVKTLIGRVKRNWGHAVWDRAHFGRLDRVVLAYYPGMTVRQVSWLQSGTPFVTTSASKEGKPA